jgi:hypothetical protein
MEIEERENKIMKMNNEDLNNYMFINNFYKRSMVCTGSCGVTMKYVKCSNYVDDFCWRCVSKGCTNYGKRESIRQGSFFESLGKDIHVIIKVILRWSGKQNQISILKTVAISKPLIRKVFKMLIQKMNLSNEMGRKLGGPGTVVQADETMMNFKCKSHRGRSPENKTYALCIVECAPHITRVWAQTIPNKKSKLYCLL